MKYNRGERILRVDKNMENTKEHRFEKGELERIILGSIAAVGLIAFALAAPNAVQILKMFQNKNPRHRSPLYVTGILRRLQKKGYIDSVRENGKTFLRITSKGELELLKSKEREKPKQRKWDKKWRIVIFDIKESRRGIRNKIRQDITSFGFERLQDSVWVYPYDCEELITLLKVSCRIGKDVLYIVSEKIENDQWLRKKFGLVC